MPDAPDPRYPREPACLTGRPQPTLAGREAEWLALRSAVDSLAPGPAQLLEITGEPGLGKTRLLTELAALAARRGIPSVTLSAATGPYGLDLLADVVEEEFLAARPELREPLATVRAVGDDPVARRRVAAARTILCALSTPDGLVVALDDLHRAEPVLVRLVVDLVARPPRAALLVAFAHRDRPGTVAPAPARALTRLALKPLTDAAGTALLAHVGPEARRRAVLDAGAGNPLYLSILAAGARSGADGVDLETLPTRETAPLVAELDPLSADARRAASAAAVLDGCFEPGTVAFVAGLTDSASYRAIDELARADIVRPAAGTGGFTFRHPVLRHAVYHATDPGWRLSAHARAAAVLRGRHADAHALAPHVLRVAAPGDVQAAATLADAAAAVRGSSPATAVTWLRAASRLLPDGPATAGRRASVHLELGEALAAAGRAAEARDVAQEVLLALARPDPARPRAVSLCARLDWLLGHGPQGTALLRRELEQAALPDDQAAALLIELAGYELLAARPGHTAGLAARASGLAAARPVVAAVHGLRAMAYCLDGDSGAAATECDLAAALLDGLLDLELAAHLDAAVWVGWSEIILERPWESLRHVERAWRVGRTSGRHASLTWLLAARVHVLRGVGRLPEATASAGDAVRLAAASGSAALRGFAAVLAGWVAAWTGDGAGGWDRAPDRTVPGWFGQLHQSMYAEIVASGDGPDDGDDGPTGADPWSRVAWLEARARIALANGRADLADAHGRAALAAADRLGLPGRRALALLAYAHGLAGRDPATAPAVATSAAAGLAAAGLGVDARRAGVVAGRALAAVERRDLAEAELSGAQRYFEQSGAARLARDTARLRVRLAGPAHPGGRERPDPASLTIRERQVAGLVGDGLTNREIARRLRVKEKTVEMHLTRVFAKLGVTNRVGVVREVLRGAGAGRPDGQPPR